MENGSTVRMWSSARMSCMCWLIHAVPQHSASWLQHRALGAAGSAGGIDQQQRTGFVDVRITAVGRGLRPQQRIGNGRLRPLAPCPRTRMTRMVRAAPLLERASAPRRRRLRRSALHRVRPLEDESPAPAGASRSSAASSIAPQAGRRHRAAPGIVGSDGAARDADHVSRGRRRASDFNAARGPRAMPPANAA